MNTEIFYLEKCSFFCLRFTPSSNMFLFFSARDHEFVLQHLHKHSTIPCKNTIQTLVIFVIWAIEVMLLRFHNIYFDLNLKRINKYLCIFIQVATCKWKKINIYTRIIFFSVLQKWCVINESLGSRIQGFNTIAMEL